MLSKIIMIKKFKIPNKLSPENSDVSWQPSVLCHSPDMYASAFISLHFCECSVTELEQIASHVLQTERSDISNTVLPGVACWSLQ